MIDYKAIGNNIKNARLKANLTLLELAKEMKTTPATLSRYENGNTRKMQIDFIDKNF